ncbi:MAG: Pyruvoyl-dependent arginine decarboxylase [Candidatus Heimdallarchaeota archaeon AB_125]|nr:MAG: Pyruvoyl-dependent arginine decarboxylase [Candidatus Heimdallarchaeota archaeon AB_125]
MSKPTRFWVTSGIGESDLSELDAIDKAYMNSGLGYQNHISVSSIPPAIEISPEIDKEKGITYVNLNDKLSIIPFSANIHVVKSLSCGSTDENLSTCIALAKIYVNVNDFEIPCILAFESKGEFLEETKTKALDGVKSMVRERKADIDSSWGSSGFKIINSNLKITKKHGCSVSFVVFDPFTYQNE